MFRNPFIFFSISRWGDGTYRQVPDQNKFITDGEPPVNLGRPAVHDLCDVTAIVAGDVLIARAARDAESESFVAFAQLDFDDARRAGLSAPSHALKKRKVNQVK